MAGASKKTLPSGLRRAWYTNWCGKQTFFTQRGNYKEVKAQAESLEAKHRRHRLEGTAPKTSDMQRPFDEAKDEYLAWGKAQGGRRGYPWGKKHAEKRTYFLKFWKKRLGLAVLGDLRNCLPRVEKALRELRAKGKAGKTLNSYADGLSAFCDWCVGRGYMDADPLNGLAPFDATPKTMRRCLTADEAYSLLYSVKRDGTAWALRRRMGYAVALCSGLRRGELMALRVKHLDTVRNGLRLEARWTKNRCDGWQPLPKVLVKMLADTAKGKGQEAPLLFVARETSNALEKDLERAELKRWGPGGKVDFHALRHTYVTMLHTAGATFEEARLLARHAARGLTDGTYLHVSITRLQELAEMVGKAVLPEAAKQAQAAARKTGTDGLEAKAVEDRTGDSADYAPSMHKEATRKGTSSTTSDHGRDLAEPETKTLQGFKSLPAHHLTPNNYPRTTA